MAIKEITFEEECIIIGKRKRYLRERGFSVDVFEKYDGSISVRVWHKDEDEPLDGEDCESEYDAFEWIFEYLDMILSDPKDCEE